MLIAQPPGAFSRANRSPLMMLAEMNSYTEIHASQSGTHWPPPFPAIKGVVIWNPNLIAQELT